MSREIKRVPLDFEWPLDTKWSGFLMPKRLAVGKDCPNCESGYSPHAKNLFDQWYGYTPFDPAATGSTPLTAETPAVLAFAKRNVEASPQFYGRDPLAVAREATRLANLWNGQWSHHLDDEDVAALVEAGRLMDFTHTWVKGQGWVKNEPVVVPSAAAVNEWSLRGFAHDSINASVAIRARCERDGQPSICGICDGHGSLEAYEGQRAQAEAWEPTEPPTGDGWQLWETVSEGSPVSPVFAGAEDLAHWLTTAEGGQVLGPSGRPLTIDQAHGFVSAGWSPQGFINAGGVHDGAEFVGTERALGGLVGDGR